MKKKVFTLGDAMITFNPTSTGPMRFVNSFERKIGGAELNFAIGCARLGLDVKWFSRLGTDEFGTYIFNTVRGEGVDVSDVKFVEGRPTSLNFKEVREDGSTKTFYYRYESPILTITPSDIQESTLDNIDFVHLTGVFLAIAPQNLDVALKVLQIAKEKNIPVSFDPNIRLKLWTIKEARETYLKIFPYVDVLLSGLDELKAILQKDTQSEFEAFAKNYDIQELIIKDGSNGSKALANGIWKEKKAFSIKPVDTVGAGDGFNAGYVFGLLHNYSLEERLTFANAVGAMVTTVIGDNEGLPSFEEVQIFLGNKTLIER